MSRHEFRHEDGESMVAYGLDPVPMPGYFLQVLQPDEDEGFTLTEDMDTRPLITHDPVHRTDIAQRLKELGGPTEHVERILADQKL